MAQIRTAALWLLAMLLIVVIGDRAASFLLRQPLARSGFRFARLLRGGVDAGVIVVGDSRGVTSINVPQIERMTGRRVFTFAYNAMPLTVAEALLADYLDRNRPPKLAVIEVTAVVEAPGLLADLGAYAALSPRLAALYAAEHPMAARAATLFSLLRFNNELYWRTLYYLRRPDQDWANTAVMPAQEAARVALLQPLALQPRPDNLDALVRMVRLLESRHVEVRLLIGPYLPRFAQSSNVGAVAALIAARTRHPVWNYAAAVDGPENFADVIHVNATGAAQFAATLQRDRFLEPGAAPH